MKMCLWLVIGLQISFPSGKPEYLKKLEEVLDGICGRNAGPCALPAYQHQTGRIRHLLIIGITCVVLNLLPRSSMPFCNHKRA